MSRWFFVLAINDTTLPAGQVPVYVHADQVPQQGPAGVVLPGSKVVVSVGPTSVVVSPPVTPSVVVSPGNAPYCLNWKEDGDGGRGRNRSCGIENEKFLYLAYTSK